MPDITQNCRITGKSFVVSETDQALLQKLAPTIGGQRFDLPLPTLSPKERMRRRLAVRNERHLYLRKCDLCQKMGVSMYDAEAPYTVYCNDCWYDGDWDDLAHGRDFDFSRPFFEQFAELFRAQPKRALITAPHSFGENSHYVNCAGNNKNSYMIFDADFNEDSYYSNLLKHSRDCMDCSFVHYSELCYDCTDCHRCYNLRFSQDCRGCSDSAFLLNCRNVKNSTACVNLDNKEYCLFNQQLTKEAYEKALKDLCLDTHSGLSTLRQRFDDWVKTLPTVKRAQQIEDSTGHYLENVKNAKQCFDVGYGQDFAYCDTLYRAQDCMDVSSFGEQLELAYECTSCGLNASRLAFTYAAFMKAHHIYYSQMIYGSQHCFGSTGLRRQQFCLLNKAYSEADYNALVPKVIEHMKSTGEWGEFFPMTLSPFAYNESMAQIYFPLSPTEAAERGLRWRTDDKTQDYQGPTVALPDSIQEAKPSICQEILRCETSGKLYKIIPQELAFYKKMGIPVPRRAPDQRYLDRMAKRRPRFDAHD